MHIRKSVYRSNLLNCSAMAGAIAAAMLTSATAQAADVNNLLVTGVTNVAGGCRIDTLTTVTGTTDDGGGVDFYQILITNELGQRPIIPLSASVAVGSTSTRGQSFVVPVTAGADKYFLTVIDTAQSGTAPHSGPTIARHQVPDILLSSAGGNCGALLSSGPPPGNSPPIVNAGNDQTVPGGSGIQLGGSVSDPDGDPTSVFWAQTAGPAVTINNPNSLSANLILQPAGLTNQVYVFELRGSDGYQTATDSRSFTVLGSNLPPSLTVNVPSTAPGGSVQLFEAQASDPDGDPVTLQWSQTSGPAATITSPTSGITQVTLPPKTGAAQTLVFTVTATDSNGASVTESRTLEIPANVGPVANAGPNTDAGSATTVSLDGTGSSDGDGDAITYTWTQTGGPAVTLTGANTATPSFVAPVVNSGSVPLEFTLVVGDGINTASDTVTITALPNQAPVVDAGADQTVSGGASVTLSGTANDGDGDPLTYNWVQISGPGVSLTGAATLTPSFTAPQRTVNQQQLVFELQVDDGANATVTDTVTVTIPANQAPLANITGPTSVSGGQSFILDGSGSSDPDGDPLVYSWAHTAGPAPTIQNPNSATPTIIAPVATNTVQTFEITLTVADPFDATASTRYRVNVAANNAPVADAGVDQTVNELTPVTLDGSNSNDPDGDAITYAWTQVAGPLVTLSDPTVANPTFFAPPKSFNAQSLVFELVVDDSFTQSSPDQVVITIPGNLAPTADAGLDQTVGGNSMVSLDGTASFDPDGDVLTYSWVQTSGPAVTLSDPNAAQPTFTAPAGAASAQLLTFSLTVSDGFASDVAEVEVSIAANQPPIAEAGADQGPIDSGQTVMLDGSGSSDPDGDALTYSWVQVSGTPVTLSDPAAESPTFTAPLVNGTEDLVFQLVVNDGQVDSVADTVTIGVRAIGSVTIVQRVEGSDVSVAFTSDIADLNRTIATSGGSGQVTATSVSAGSHTVSAANLLSQGYVLTSIVCDDSDSTVDVASRTVDIELSPNEDLTCTFSLANTRDATLSAINNFLTGRNALILSHQPDLQRRLDRVSGVPASGGSASAFGVPVPGAGYLPLSATVDGRSARVSSSLAQARSSLGSRSSGGFDVWAEGYFSQARIGVQEGKFSIMYAGADVLLTEGLLLGGLVQWDEFSDNDSLERGEGEGDGWMVGPYVTARLAPNLFAEARAAWGQSDNVVNPIGDRVEAFQTSRGLYSASLVGQFDVGQDTTLRPEVTVRYIEEQQQAFTDSFGVSIAEQTIGQGDISLRPRISHSLDVGSDWSLRPYGEVEGIYTFSADDGRDPSGSFGLAFGQEFDELRGRAEIGVDLFSPGSFRATLSGFHDGIGSSQIRSTGIHFGVSFGF